MLPLLLAAILVGGALQRITGMGFALVAGPFVVLMIGAEQGVLLINILGATSSLLIMLRVRKEVDWRWLAYLAAASVVTTPVAAVLLSGATGPALEATMGLAVVVGMTVALLADRLRTDGRLWREGARWPALLAGAVAGVGSVAAGVGGPPMAAYAVLDKADPRRFAATLQPFFVINATGSAVSKLLLTDAPMPPLRGWQWGVVAVALVGASLVGDVVAKHVPRAAVRRVLIVVAYLGGTATLLRGLGVLPG
ncbi:sulfite exporter TauE/SafE family protein [Xylanimonas protaetiae]|uniref:Probable membrane transporter protein n=1 Tax=Xylanimonas protaetiae TaxID=2509457 RepID=A0A4V0YFS0_9MICO|nr:sulfite exporter TauE/SafE family protein [Xylanimonas protaetiae]QAY68681.1 sulfite exporter TauE/SafE family protein [Xylanimonas protaetiae]